MKYVIAGASTYGVDNMGDDAMLSCLLKAINERNSQADITFLARHPNASFDNAFQLKSIKNLDHNSNVEAKGRFFLGFNKGDDRKNLLEINAAISKAEALIIGGNSLMEISENLFLRGVSSYAAILASFALFMNKPYGLFGLNIVDPIRSELVARQAKFLIENAVLVTAREPEVLKYLDQINVNTDNILIAGDPAYGVDLERVSLYSGEDILAREKIFIKENSRLVSICIREEYWKTDSESIESLSTEIAALLHYILEDSNFEVLFIPNCTYEKGHPLEDDRVVNRFVRDRFGENSRVHYIEQKLNIYETLALFKMIDIHISNRRHSNIFAALFSKPFVPINTSLKSHMSAFLMEIDYEKFLISSRKFSGEVCKVLDSLLSNYSSISERLEGAVSLQKQRSHSSVTRLIEAFRSGSHS